MKRKIRQDAFGKVMVSHRALTDRLYEIRSERDELHRIAECFATATTSHERMLALELWVNYKLKEREQ